MSNINQEIEGSLGIGFSPFDDSLSEGQKLMSSLFTNVKDGMDTSAFDAWRQGIELSLPMYVYGSSQPKLWAGNIKGLVNLSTYGQAVSWTEYKNSAEWTDDIIEFDPYLYITGQSYYPSPIYTSGGPMLEEEAILEPLTIPFRKSLIDGFNPPRQIHAGMDDGNIADNYGFGSSTDRVRQFIEYDAPLTPNFFLDAGQEYIGAPPMLPIDDILLFARFEPNSILGLDTVNNVSWSSYFKPDIISNELTIDEKPLYTITGSSVNSGFDWINAVDKPESPLDYPGHNISSLSFDAVDTTYAAIPNLTDKNLWYFGNSNLSEPEKPFSVSMWIKPNGVAFQPLLLTLGNGTDTRWYIWVISSGIGCTIVSQNDPSSNRIERGTASGSVVDGVWQHIVVTYDGTRRNNGIKIYINGVNASNVIGDSGFYNYMNDTNLTSTSDVLLIGGFGLAPVYYTGQMDEILITKTALNEYEVKAIYNWSYLPGYSSIHLDNIDQSQTSIQNSIVVDGFIPDIQRTGSPFDDTDPQTVIKQINVGSGGNSAQFLANIISLNIGLDDDIREVYTQKSATAGFDVYGTNQSIYGTDSVAYVGTNRGS